MPQADAPAADRGFKSAVLSFERDGTALGGFAAWCPSATPMPGLVLIPDVFGLSELYRRVALRFATAGFFTFVLDPYSREGAPVLGDMADVFAWIRGLDDRRMLDDIGAAVAFVAARAEVSPRKVGVTGFCLGGQYALMSACSRAGIRAAVSFYGMLRYQERPPHQPRSPLDMAADLACPYLGIFGAEDELIPDADVRELEGILRREGKTYAMQVYPGAGHAFCNDERPAAYRPQAAADAFERAIDHFHQHLGTV